MAESSLEKTRDGEIFRLYPHSEVQAMLAPVSERKPHRGDEEQLHPIHGN